MNITIHGKKINTEKLEKVAKKNRLYGNLEKFNRTLCPVCGNILKRPIDMKEGIHEKCVDLVSK